MSKRHATTYHITPKFNKKDNFLIRLSGPSISKSSKTKVRFILPVTIRKRVFFFLQTIEGMTIEGINIGLVRMYVTPYRISWIIFTLDLVIGYIDNLLVFRWVQIVLLL